MQLVQQMGTKWSNIAKVPLFLPLTLTLTLTLTIALPLPLTLTRTLALALAPTLTLPRCWPAAPPMPSRTDGTRSCEGEGEG